MKRRHELKLITREPYYDLPNEVWKDIAGYEGLYQVSDLGRVKSLAKHCKFHRKTPTIRKQFLNEDGYLVLQLFKNNEFISVGVHRLVALAFIPNPENKAEVNHKKGIKIDNRATELEWNTPKENVNNSFLINGNYVLKAEKHPQSKLTNLQVTQMRQEYIKGKRGEIIRLSLKYNICTSSVKKILCRNSYKSVV